VRDPGKPVQDVRHLPAPRRTESLPRQELKQRPKRPQADPKASQSSQREQPRKSRAASKLVK